MSSFLLKKKTYAGSFAFLFQFEEIGCRIACRMLVEAYGDNALSETTCRDWFRRFYADNFDLSDKKRENRPRKVENCRLFWTRTIPNRKKWLLNNWVFLKQPFPCGYMPWGRFKRSENGCRMNWMIGRWSDAKTHAKFCLSDKKESRSCIGLWQAMKSGSIFGILNARNFGLISPNYQHLPPRPNRFEGKTMLCVWWDQEGAIYYELLKPGETINILRYHWSANNWSNCTVLCVKKGCIIGKNMTSWFSSTTTHHRTRQQWFKTTWRHSTGKCYPIPFTHQT